MHMNEMIPELVDQAYQLTAAAEVMLDKARNLAAAAADYANNGNDTTAIIACGFGCGQATELIYETMGEMSGLLDMLPRETDAERSSTPSEVDVSLGRNYILVRVPPLWSRFGSSRGRDRYDRNYHYFYSDVVRSKMLSLSGDLRHYSKKNVSVINVYPANRTHIPDADNVDAKAITDAIVQQLGGDQWDTCTFFRQCIRCDHLLPGSYFIITPGLGAPSCEQLYAFISEWRDSHA